MMCECKGESVDIKCDQIQVKAKLKTQEPTSSSASADVDNGEINETLTPDENCECAPENETLNEDDLARWSSSVAVDLKRYVDLKFAQFVRQKRP